MASNRHRQVAADTARANFTRHGLAAGETKATYYVCKSIWRTREVAWPDLPSFVRGVVAEVGVRPPDKDGCTWRLEARDDLRHLVTGSPSRDDLLDAAWDRGAELSEIDRLSYPVFKPGHIEWVTASRKMRRRDRPKSTKPLPAPGNFVKSDWGHPDPERQRAKRRERAEHRRTGVSTDR